MKLALIVRADSGGIAQQSFEMARHLQPDRILIVTLGKHARGHEDVGRYSHIQAEQRVHEGDVIPTDLLRWLSDGVDTVCSVECWYHPQGGRIIRECGARPVLVTNPELLTDTDSDLLIPTTWEQHRIPSARVLPHPVAADVGIPRSNRHARTFLHLTAPAMHDRNGTSAITKAVPHITEECTILVRTDQITEAVIRKVGPVTIEWLPAVTHHSDLFTADVDVLLIPRRYGGLCLPAQEAAAVGVPTLMTALPPQLDWPFCEATISVTTSTEVTMRGGRFPVWEVSPQSVAACIDHLVRTPDRYRELVAACHDWTETHSWDALLPAWKEALT